MKNLMKKNLGKKLMALMMVTAVIITTLPATEVQAAASPKFPKTIDMLIYSDNAGKSVSQGGYYSVIYPTSNGKVTQLKSSNVEVATVDKTTGTPNNTFLIMPNSPGTTKVTFKYAGKKFTSTVNVISYENPFSSIKIGSRNFTKNFNASNHYSLHKQKKNLKGKLKITLKKGWKIKSINVVHDTSKKVKNNSTVTLKANKNKWGSPGTSLVIRIQNTKTKKNMFLQLDYSNSPQASCNYSLQLPQ